MSDRDEPTAGGSRPRGIAPASDFLARVVRDHPLPESPREARELRRRVRDYLILCGYCESIQPKNGRLLSVECESGLLEILLKQEYGFTSIVGISNRSSLGLVRRLAAFGIGIVSCRVDKESIPEEDGTFTAILFPRVQEHLRPSLSHVLAECRRVLRSGGTLILGTTHVAELGRRAFLRKHNQMAKWQGRSALLMGNPGHGKPTGEPNEQELTALLGDAGFVIEKLRLVAGSLRIWPGPVSGLWPWGPQQLYFIARRP